MSFYELASSIDISDATKWQQTYQHTYNAVNQPSVWCNYKALPWTPIPEQLIPLLFDNHVLAVTLSCSNQKSSWETGGWAKVYARTGASGTSEHDGYYLKRKLYLNTLNLLVVPIVTADFKVKLSFPYWFSDATVTIYEYNQEPQSFEHQELVEIEARLESIENFLQPS